MVSDKIQDLKKTKEAVLFLKKVKAWTDVEKVRLSSAPHASRVAVPLQYLEHVLVWRVSHPILPTRRK